MTPWKHWGLQSSPFRGTCAHFHRGEPQDEALARLQFLVEEGRTLGLVCGSTGSGKSRVLAEFARELRLTGRRVIEQSLLGLTGREWLASLNEQLGTATSPQDTLELWRAITDRLVEQRYQGASVVLLCDDAGAMPGELHTSLTRLALLAANSGGALTIVLAMASQETKSLALRLRELCELRVDLQPWLEEETATFVRETLEQAGSLHDIFLPDALLRIHELSEGLPRRAAHLAEVALLAGSAAEIRQIDEFTIDGVFQEFAPA